MKSISKSLRLLKLLLSISWWGTALITLLTVVIGVTMVFDPGKWEIDLIVFAGSVDTRNLSVETSDGHSAKVEFEEPVRLRVAMPKAFWESRRGTVAIGWATMVAVLGLFLYFLQQLRQMIHSVEHGNPFVSRNAKRLRIMGILILVGGAVGSLSQFAMSGYADVVLRPEGFNLNGHLGLDFSSLILGLSVLVLSEVFRIGTKMQEEQEFTI